MSTERRFIFANGSSMAVSAAGIQGPPIEGPMGDDMADAFAYATACAVAPRPATAVVSARLTCPKCGYEAAAERLPDGRLVAVESCKCPPVKAPADGPPR